MGFIKRNAVGIVAVLIALSQPALSDGFTASYRYLFAPVTITSNSATPPDPGAGTNLHIVGATSSGPFMLLDGFNANGQYRARRANGTISSPSGVLPGEQLGNFGVDGYTSAGAYAGGIRGRLGFFAAESWTGTAQGTYASISTTATGDTTIQDRFRVMANGSVQFRGPNASGTTTATLGTTSPAVGTTPFIWLTMEASDGARIYIPAWR